MSTPGTRARLVFISVATLLLTAGWSANHFASVLVALREQLNLSPLLVNGAYGIYALGLVPSLLVGGALADRFGGRLVALAGSLIAVVGNSILMLFHGAPGLLTGRFIVGLGVGLVVSAGTAWAARLNGAAGSTLAGIVLTSGFALGPVISGLAEFAFSPLWLPFVLSIIASLMAVVFSLRTGDMPRRILAVAEDPQVDPSASPRKALATSVPVAMWVFAAITTAFVGLAARVAEYFETGVFLPGIAAAVGFGAGLAIQAAGRRWGWGPGSGVVGILCAGAGFLVVALGGEAPLTAAILPGHCAARARLWPLPARRSTGRQRLLPCFAPWPRPRGLLRRNLRGFRPASADAGAGAASGSVSPLRRFDRHRGGRCSAAQLADPNWLP